MQGTRKFLVVFTALAGMNVGINTLAAAQRTSKAGHVSLVAVMPERLTLTANTDSVDSILTIGNVDGSATVVNLTTSWALLPGRAQVATSAHLMNATPILLATAMDFGINPFTTESWSVPQFSLARHDRHFQIARQQLSNISRTGTNTVKLLQAMEEVKPPLLSDLPSGTLKIQVDAVP